MNGEGVDVEAIVAETVEWDYARTRAAILGTVDVPIRSRPALERIIRLRTNQQRDLIEHVIELTRAQLVAQVRHDMQLLDDRFEDYTGAGVRLRIRGYPDSLAARVGGTR